MLRSRIVPAVSRALRCGALCGLALLGSSSAIADETLREAIRQQLRNENYMLVEDRNGARLFVFSAESMSSIDYSLSENETAKALAMTRSADSRTRVLGLTLLSGVDDPDVPDAALILLSDPEVAVREEAVQLLAEHPEVDIASVIALAANDPSERVRLIAAELLEERQDESGD